MNQRLQVLNSVADLAMKFVDDRPPESIHDQQVYRYGLQFLKAMTDWAGQKDTADRAKRN